MPLHEAVHPLPTEYSCFSLAANLPIHALHLVVMVVVFKKELAFIRFVWKPHMNIQLLVSIHQSRTSLPCKLCSHKNGRIRQEACSPHLVPIPAPSMPPAHHMNEGAGMSGADGSGLWPCKDRMYLICHGLLQKESVAYRVDRYPDQDRNGPWRASPSTFIYQHMQ